METILAKVLPVFLTLILGIICRKRGFLDENRTQTLKDVVVNVTLPFVLVSAFGGTAFTPSNLKIPAIIFVACIVALYLGRLICRVLGMQGQVMPYLTSGFEAGMMGYSLFAVLYAGLDTSAFALIDLGQVTFVFTVYRILLSGRHGARDIVSNIVRTPVIWGMVLGIVLSISGLYGKAEGTINAVVDFISAPTAAIILLCIGSDMVAKKVNPRRALAPVAVRIVTLAAVYSLVVLVDGLLGAGIHRGALLLMFALPAPFVLPIFATVDEERSDIASALSIQTVLTLVFFAVMAAII